MRVIHAELEKTGFKYFAIIEENKAVSGIFQRCSWFVITHKVQFWYIAGKRDCNISETVQIKDLIITTMIMYNTTAALFPGVCVAYEWFVHLHSKWKWRMTGSVCLIVHIKKWAGGGKKWQHNTNLTVSEVQTASCMTGEIWCTKWGHAEVRRCTRTCNVTTLSKTWTSCRYFEQTEIKTTIIRVIGTSIIL